MKRIATTTAAALLSLALIQSPAGAQQYHQGSHPHANPHLHINDRWDECSFQLSSNLTQAALRQFTGEAGLVVYFRPLADARPMGRGNFEVSLVQWETGIDDADAAWNDTFVHPDSTHVLFDGSRLAFPGLMMRAGVTATTDVGFYLTKSPGANYGFYGAQLQRNLIQDADREWAAATRVSFVSLFGPEDVAFTVYGVDGLVSRTLTLTRWAAISPYAGGSVHLTAAREKSGVVDLDDERVIGTQATIGAAMQLSAARLSVEYNVSRVNTLSFKLGFGR